VSFSQKKGDGQGRTILLTDCKHMMGEHHDTNKKKNDGSKDTLVEKSLNEDEHDDDGKSKESKVMQQLYNVD